MKIDSSKDKVADFIRRYWLHLILALALVLIFRGWLNAGPVARGDWAYFTSQRIREYLRPPFAWDPALGLGIPNLIYLYYFPQMFIMGLMATIGIPWAYSERLVWLFPCVVITPLSSYYLGKTLFKEREPALATAAVFTLNSFFFERLSSFGHVPIVASYALAPLVLALLVRAKRERGLRYPVLGGLALCLQFSCDIRIGYLTVLVAIAGWIFLSAWRIRSGPGGLRESLRWGGYLATTFGILIGFNLFWILPNLFGSGMALPSDLGQSWWVSVLSFNKLIHAFTMHDVSWPGRTFQQIGIPAKVNPLFILFPIVGFGTAMIALGRAKRDRAQASIALSSCALVLLGTFLVSGASFPDKGRIYVWLFNNLPGFSMFRDPSKMYLYVCLGYALLFGLAAAMAGEWLRSKTLSSTRSNYYSRTAPAAAILLLLLLLALPAFSQSLDGISKPIKIPKGLMDLDRMLEHDTQYCRTFWYPETHRFAPMSNTHPALNGNGLLSEQLPQIGLTQNPLSGIQSPLLPGILDAMAVRLMVVPEDPEAWIYPRFSDTELAEGQSGFESLAAGVTGNLPAKPVGKSAVFTRLGGKDHFFVPSRTINILGGWKAALMAHGAPGLDLNRSIYFLSDQGQMASDAFTSDFPTDAFLFSGQTALDAVMPLTGGMDIIPVAGAANKPDPGAGWVSIPTGQYHSGVIDWLHCETSKDLSGDYGLGAALVGTIYEPLPANWQKRAKLIKTIDMGASPIQLTTDNKELRLRKNISNAHTGTGSLEGTMGPHPPHNYWRIAWSSNIECAPSHPYGVRFMMSGQRVGALHSKITFFNKLNQEIGEQIIWDGKAGSFKSQEVLNNFATPAETASLRFEVWSRENTKYTSSWNLGNVEIFDLAGMFRHPSLQVRTDVRDKKTYHLMARCFNWDGGGKIGFSVDGGKPLFLNTSSLSGRLGWNEVGRIKLAAGGHEIEIMNLEGTNLVNAIALATDEELSNSGNALIKAMATKDISCALDLGLYPKKISYASGNLTRTGTVYSPTNTTLVPTFRDNKAVHNSGISLKVNGTDLKIPESLTPTVQAGWIAAPGVSLPRGEVEVQVSCPAASLVNPPTSRRSIGRTGSEWSSVTEGLTLSAEPSKERGQMNLAGQVNPGDQRVARVARSKQFDINPKTKYSSFVKLDGQSMKGLQVALLMLDKDGRELGRAALTDEMNGTFNGSEVFREVETTHEAARYGAVEVICHPDAQGPTSWRLSGLFLNETSSTASPIDKIALVPQSWAQGSAGTTRKEEPPAKVKVLESSPTGYRVKVIDAKRPFMLVFSEQYAPDWELFIDGKKIKPVPVDTLLNGYPLKKKGTYEVSIRYSPQKWVNIGLVPSILTLIACFAFLIVKRRKRKKTEKKEGTL